MECRLSKTHGRKGIHRKMTKPQKGPPQSTDPLRLHILPKPGTPCLSMPGLPLQAVAGPAEIEDVFSSDSDEPDFGKEEADTRLCNPSCSISMVCSPPDLPPSLTKTHADLKNILVGRSVRIPRKPPPPAKRVEQVAMRSPAI